MSKDATRIWIVREYLSARHLLSGARPVRTKRVEAATRKEAIATYRQLYSVAPERKLTAQSER